MKIYSGAKIIIFFLVGFALLALLLQRFQWSLGQFSLPFAGTDSKTTEHLTQPDRQIEKNTMVNGKIKHSVPLDEIISGGPPQDGIPSIDHPQFISIKQAEKFLNDAEPGIAFSKGKTSRFYPYQILVWHEIVNDTVEGERILVTYCPLCLSGIVFAPLVQGAEVEFGTSGKLWNSNLVMYDRKTNSLWSQILGEAIVGKMTGAKLAVLPSDQVRFGKWKTRFPAGEVLSRATGATRFYGTNPYGDYFSVQGFSLNMVKQQDSRLPKASFVFGIVVAGRAKAYNLASVKKQGLVEDEFAGESLVLRYDQELDVVRVFKKLPQGGFERVNPFSTFWFAWVAAHPATDLYK